MLYAHDARDFRRAVDLFRVALAVVESDGRQAVDAVLCVGRDRRGVEAAGEQDYGVARHGGILADGRFAGCALPFPLVAGQPEVAEHAGHRAGAVERVEVHAVDAVVPQLPHLARGVLYTQLSHRVVVALVPG